MGKAEDYTTTSTGFNSGNAVHTEPLKTRVEADHAAEKTQLKAEHGKELAQLKAEEVQARADLDARHAQTKGGTGFIAKITGNEDPAKKAEKEQLEAEIGRAEQATKAQHTMEKADLDARTTNEKASVNAASKLRADTHNSAGFGSGGLHNTNATGLHHTKVQQQPLKTRVEADHAAEKTQLKAEHGKEMAELKAEEVERRAALKAEHAQTKGGTGFFAKITGNEDPVKKAEKEQLKAEMDRAEEATKAQHAKEKADLDAKIAKDKAAVGNTTTASTLRTADNTTYRTTTY